MSSTRRLVLLLACLCLFACGSGSGDDTAVPIVRDVAPGMGVEAYQVSLWDPQMTLDSTSWGRLRIDPAALAKETGIAGGWLNVATAEGWVLVNFPVPPADEGPFAVYFDLGLGQPEPLQQIALHVKHSNQGFGKISDQLQEAALFPIDQVTLNRRGFGPEARIDAGIPPLSLSLESILDRPFTITTWTQQLTNEQCAQDQCGPMAFANAFQYLENMGVWTIPNVHDMGLGGDTTLVGQFDTLSGRSFSSRPVGSGVSSDAIVDAALEYVATNGISTGMTFRHQDEGYGSSLPTSNYNAHGLTSQYDGGVPTYAWLRDRIGAGCGVVAGYSHSSGGHMVRVTGVKVDNAGNEWMRYTHDRLQTGSDPSDTQGLETVWVQLSDLDGDGILNLGTPTSELRILWAVCP